MKPRFQLLREKHSTIRAKLEQHRQARSIHGGWLNMFGAAMCVKLSRIPLPARIRPSVYRQLYGRKYDSLDESELEKPLAEYRSLNELFTRGVRQELRPLAKNVRQHLICPCDGTVQAFGRVDDDTVMQVKNISYQLQSLAPETDVSMFRDGHYAILFLSPRDCHRVFSPQDGTLTGLTHVPGHRLLVHPPFQREEFPVFTLNERLVMHLETSFGRCLLIMVAGWGVGHISHPFTTGLKPRGRRISQVQFRIPRHVAAGDWLATFELGSTVVLVAESDPQQPIRSVVESGDTVRYGQSLFTTASVTHQ
jgi:phosphatidylserine decarboxylase